FLYPAQSTYYEKKDIKFFRITLQSERYLSLMSAPFVFFTIVMAPEILNIFRSSLILYSTPLIILMIYAYLNVINRPYSTQLTSANRPHEVMKMGVIQASANVVLNAIFIPRSILGIPLFGLKSTGAALATLLSFLIGFAYLRYRVYKLLDVKYEKRIIIHLLAGAVSAGFIYLFKIAGVSFFSWYEILGIFVLFTGIYLLVLFLFREIGREEIEFILRIIK
ncbi:MAG: polysaccharide biosynthesis protein, partial [Nitrospiraceae bacterium]|nr:polysaccharide biosynthesis protein [Nitrospiraceae bacterium]